MRAIVVHRLGSPAVLELEDLPCPEPGPGQVLVRLQAVGVNFADTERRRGLYMSPTLPWRPGSEGAGDIVEVGPGVDAALLDKRVAFWAMPPATTGCYSEYAVAPINSLFHLPDLVPYDTGAALPLQGLTAYGLAFFAAKIRPGMSVLIHAAAGGIGQLLVQLAHLQGARVFGTTSTAEKASRVNALGAECFLYGKKLKDQISEATEGRGVDLIYDSIGQATQLQNLELLAMYGEVVHFGEASGPLAKFHPEQLYERCLKVGCFGLNVEHAPEAWAVARQELLAWVEQKELKLSISLRLPLAEAAKAHEKLESRATTGKVVLLPVPAIDVTQ